MSANQNIKLGDLLIQKGWIAQGQLEQALAEQKVSREFLGEILLKNHSITEEQLAIALSEQFKMPFVRLKSAYLNWDLVMKFSTGLVMDHQCFPLQSDGLTVTFAIINPLDAWVRAQIERELHGKTVKLVLTTKSEMKDCLDRYRQYLNMKIRQSFDQKS